MGRQAASHVTLPGGTLVGYGFKDRGGVFRVQFKHPTEKKYLEVSTGCTTLADAYQAAAGIILAAYRPTLPPVPRTATWGEALDHLRKTPDLRPDSVRGYATAVNAVLKLITGTGGPGDITEAAARHFKREFLGGTFRRGYASDAASYRRSPATCTCYLRSLRSLWAKHWQPAGFVAANPWKAVPYPNAAKGRRVRMPEEDHVAALLEWLTARHPGWALPRLFVEVKLATGCRTSDLCKTLSADLNGANLTFTAEVVKTRTARTTPLPPELAAKLHAVKGPTYLWERSVADGKVYRPSPKTQGRTAYDPSTWRWTVQNLFREFNKGRPLKHQVRPHDLRARAITLVAAATQSVDATAEALGVDPQTARHYLERSRAFNGSEVMTRLAGVLLPQSPPPGPAPG